MYTNLTRYMYVFSKLNYIFVLFILLNFFRRKTISETYLTFPGCSEIIHANTFMIFLWTVNLGGTALYRYSIKSQEAEVPEIVHDLLISQKNESRLKCLLQLTVSVQDQSSGRSPGTDRLMAELCKDLWPLIHSSLYLLFIKCPKLDPHLFQNNNS